MPTVVILVLISVGLILVCRANEESNENRYTNSWAVHVNTDHLTSVSELAVKHGFINRGQIGSLPGYYHFVKEPTKRRNARSLDGHAELLRAEPEVRWVEQQRVLDRSKRNVIPDDDSSKQRQKRDMAVSIRDPFYKDQWYLQNIGQSSGPAGLDINVLPVWGRGYSGKGVVVSILDDGVDHTHPDLKTNYDPDASFDFNDFDPDPKPRSKDPLNCHGTKCAGEVAAEANNGICGVGVSFNASIGGIRMLDGQATDTIEGSSLSYRSDYIDIYTCCWGPKDDGKRFGKPGFLAGKALKIGAERGRGGRGNIFVWATGNGGLTDDDCNCDGYTTSIYTVSIGAISDHGLSTYYTETCASTLAVTFSGASHREAEENKIVTTGLDHKCTNTFKGTSSAAPLASGILALVLEANPYLTWRDVQHIIVETSQKTSPLDEGWKRNGAGKLFNHKFGFGKLDATKMIEKAIGWQTVTKQRVCHGTKHDTARKIPSSGSLIMSSNTSSCAGTGSMVRKLEHVQVIVSLQHRHRGDLSITLISPAGTRTELLKTRRNDESTAGLKDWVFMTVHCWGEDPKGSWSLIVTDNDRNTREHHVTKAKQGDMEDVTRVVMDDTEKHGPWDSKVINEYDKPKPTPPGNKGTQDHILKNLEDTTGELVKGNKFIELAKRKKNRHAQFIHKSTKPNTKHWTKNITKRKQKYPHKHQQKTRKTWKHKTWWKKHHNRTQKTKNTHQKHTHTKTHFHHSSTTKHNKTNVDNSTEHKDSTNLHEEKPLMAEGSLVIPKETPLEAKMAIEALAKPNFENLFGILLPKRGQEFSGELEIMMNLLNLRKDEKKQMKREKQVGMGKKMEKKMGKKMGQTGQELKNNSTGFGQENITTPKGSVIEMKNTSHPIGTLERVDVPQQNQSMNNTEEEGLVTTSERSAHKSNSNVYKELLKSVKSLHRFGGNHSRSQTNNERIEQLTDEVPYPPLRGKFIKSKNSGSESNASNSTGNDSIGSNYSGSEANASSSTSRVTTGSNYNGSNYVQANHEKSNFTVRCTNGSKIPQVIDSEAEYGSKNDENKSSPIIIYDATNNQLATLSKVDGVGEYVSGESEPYTVVPGSDVSGSGSEMTGNGNNIIGTARLQGETVDESSGSSGVLINKGFNCATSGTNSGEKCQDNARILTSPVDDAPVFDDDGDDDEEYYSSNNSVDDVGEPIDPQEAQISEENKADELSNNLDNSSNNGEGKLAYLLSTDRYQEIPGGPTAKSYQQTATNKKSTYNPTESPTKSTDGYQDVPEGPTLRSSSQTATTTNAKYYYSPSDGPTKGPVHTATLRPSKAPKIDKNIFDPESLENYANRDLAALENALERQMSRLEGFKDENNPGENFLRRVKQDIKLRDVGDLERLEGQLAHEIRQGEEALEGAMTPFTAGQGEEALEGSLTPFAAGQGEDALVGPIGPFGAPDTMFFNPGAQDDAWESPMLERRRLSESTLKDDTIRVQGSVKDDKYGKESSGILESWSLVMYGT